MVDTATGKIRALGVGAAGGEANRYIGKWEVVELTPTQQMTKERDKARRDFLERKIKEQEAEEGISGRY
jgi:hypothetical protein